METVERATSLPLSTILPIFGFVIGFTMITLCAIALIKYIKK